MNALNFAQGNLWKIMEVRKRASLLYNDVLCNYPIIATWYDH